MSLPFDASAKSLTVSVTVTICDHVAPLSVDLSKRHEVVDERTAETSAPFWRRVSLEPPLPAVDSPVPVATVALLIAGISHHP